MHAVLANLLSVALLLHAVLGCCWHHSHACHACDQPEHAACVADEHHEHCCTVHEEAATWEGAASAEPCVTFRVSPSLGGNLAIPGHSSGPCQCRLECGGVCIYLPTQKSPAPVSNTAFDAWAVLPQAIVASDAGGQSVPIDAAEIAAPPVRLHLAHQVLLI